MQTSLKFPDRTAAVDTLENLGMLNCPHEFSIDWVGHELIQSPIMIENPEPKPPEDGWEPWEPYIELSPAVWGADYFVNIRSSNDLTPEQLEALQDYLVPAVPFRDWLDAG